MSAPIGIRTSTHADLDVAVPQLGSARWRHLSIQKNLELLIHPIPSSASKIVQSMARQLLTSTKDTRDKHGLGDEREFEIQLHD